MEAEKLASQEAAEELEASREEGALAVGEDGAEAPAGESEEAFSQVAVEDFSGTAENGSDDAESVPEGKKDPANP